MIETRSCEEILAEAVEAAREVLQRDFPNCAIVVNVAWREDTPWGRKTYGMGSRVPRRYREMMRESLLASAEETE